MISLGNGKRVEPNARNANLRVSRLIINRRDGETIVLADETLRDPRTVQCARREARSYRERRTDFSLDFSHVRPRIPRDRAVLESRFNESLADI